MRRDSVRDFFPDSLLLPVLGLLAYASLFLDFSRLHRAAQDVRAAAPVAVPADPPAGEP